MSVFFTYWFIDDTQIRRVEVRPLTLGINCDAGVQSAFASCCCVDCQTANVDGPCIRTARSASAPVRRRKLTGWLGGPRVPHRRHWLTAGHEADGRLVWTTGSDVNLFQPLDATSHMHTSTMIRCSKRMFWQPRIVKKVGDKSGMDFHDAAVKYKLLLF